MNRLGQGLTLCTSRFALCLQAPNTSNIQDRVLEIKESFLSKIKIAERERSFGDFIATVLKAERSI